MDSSCRLHKTREHPSWQDRVRDLLVAGGALALAGCTSNVADGDGNGLDRNRQDGSAEASTAAPDSGFQIPCGNANPDPCICDRPKADPAMAAACAAKIACEAMGGTWEYYSTASCSLPEAALMDAGTDAAARDAGGD